MVMPAGAESVDCEPAVAEISKEAVIARELEAELFRIHGQPQSMAYKMRFRTLKLALKESKENVRVLRSSDSHSVFCWCNSCTGGATTPRTHFCLCRSGCIVGVRALYQAFLAPGVAYRRNYCRSSSR